MSDDDIRNKIRDHYATIVKITYVLEKDGHTARIISEDESKIRFRDHNYCVMTGAYNSLEELLKSADMRPSCSCCGNIYITTFHEPVRSEMLKRNMCHGCNLWTNRIDEIKGKGNVMIAGGYYYTVYPDAPNAYFKGHGGREFKFEILATGTTIISHNVWSGGRIPEHMKHLLSDNAKIL
jgi:hypothetical protein